MEEDGCYALAESSLFGLLSTCLLRPTAGLAAAVQDGTLLEGLRVMSPDAADGDSREANEAVEVIKAIEALRLFSRRVEGRGRRETWLLLETDYNRLFVGPGKLLAPPYESFYCSKGVDGSEGRLRAKAEFDVRDAYLADGFKMPEEFVEFPDHIAVELEFCALLASKEADLWACGDCEGAKRAQVAKSEFLVGHPLAWFPECSRMVASGAKTPFYPTITSLTCAAMRFLSLE